MRTHSALRAAAYVLAVAAVMWASMWTVVLYVYWFGPAVLLQPFQGLIVGRAEAPPRWLQVLYVAVLYVAAPALVVVLARRSWWWRWGAAGLLLFNVTFLPFLAVQAAG